MEKNDPIESLLGEIKFDKDSNYKKLQKIEYERRFLENESSESSDTQSDDIQLVLPIKRPRKTIFSEVLSNSSIPSISTNKSDFDIEFIIKTLSFSFIFRNTNYENILTTIKSFYQKDFLASSVIISKNQEGNEMFILKSGKIQIEDIKNTIKEYEPGKMFGELALLHNTNYDETVKAVEDSSCWVINRITFIQLIQEFNRKNKEKIGKILKKAFGRINSEDLDKIVDAGKAEVFCCGEFIGRKGVDTGKLIVVCDGKASCNELDIEFFWDKDLAFSVLAESTVKCFTIKKDAVIRLIGEF